MIFKYSSTLIVSFKLHLLDLSANVDYGNDLISCNGPTTSLILFKISGSFTSLALCIVN